MKKNVATVDDTVGNAEICKKYCGACPTFRNNQLADSAPHELFCARGKSSVAETTKTSSCYCPACEVFSKYKLVIGYFCAKWCSTIKKSFFSLRRYRPDNLFSTCNFDNLRKKQRFMDLHNVGLDLNLLYPLDRVLFYRVPATVSVGSDLPQH